MMDQRRFWLASALSLLVVLIYQYWVVKPLQSQPSPVAPPPTLVTGTTLAPPGAPAEQPAAEPAPAADKYGNLSLDVRDDQTPIVVETDLWRATLTPQGGRLSSLVLKQFRQKVDRESPPLELVERSGLLPLTLILGAGLNDAPVVYEASTTSLSLSGDQGGQVVLTGTMKSGLEIEKRISFRGNGYLFDVDVTVRGGEVPSTIGLLLPDLEREGITTSSSSTEVVVVLSEGKVHETPLADVVKEAKTVAAASWVAFSVPFFAAAVVSTAPGGHALVERIGSTPVVRLEHPATQGATSFKVFMGPKSKEILAEAGFELSRLLDFGWFWFIAIPMLNALRWLHRFTHNYGVDIILLTCLVRAATLPLTQKSFRSMKDMQKVQPQLKRLQEQYKDDQAKLQKEMMELYKRHGVNPLSGCLPMLLQFPIFIGLYNALLHAIELRHAPFALWVTDLSAPEKLMVAGIGIPVMTIIMGASMLVQQWLTPQQTADPMQRQIMMIMPVAMTFVFINFPSGLVLYWLVSNLLGIAQQYLMLGRPK